MPRVNNLNLVKAIFGQLPASAQIRDRMYFIDNYIAAGAVATRYTYFDVKQAIASRGNMTRDGEVDYPFVLTEWAIQFWGVIADWERIFWQSKFHFEAGSDAYPEFPGTMILGGGGFTAAESPGTVAAQPAVDRAQNAIPNGRGIIMAEPIALEPGKIGRAHV